MTDFFWPILFGGAMVAVLAVAINTVVYAKYTRRREIDRMLQGIDYAARIRSQQLHDK